MSETFTFRQATLDDIPTIVSHRRRMFEDMRAAPPEILDRMQSEFAPWLRERMEARRYLTWLAECEGKIAAGAGLWLMDWPPHVVGQYPRRGNILNVYTEPEYRKRGLARLLTQQCIDWCWANQVDVIILHASEQGRSVYESMGFHATNEMRMVKPGN